MVFLLEAKSVHCRPMNAARSSALYWTTLSPEQLGRPVRGKGSKHGQRWRADLGTAAGGVAVAYAPCPIRSGR